MARKGLNKIQQNSTHSEELSPSQITAIAAITSGATITEAASKAGIDRSAIHLWLRQDAVFVAELNRAKLEQVQLVKDELRACLKSRVKLPHEAAAKVSNRLER